MFTASDPIKFGDKAAQNAVKNSHGGPEMPPGKGGKPLFAPPAQRFAAVAVDL